MTSAFTIAAVVTPPGTGGVGIIRLSGPLALSVGRRVASGLPSQPVPRHAYFSALLDGHGAVLDQGLALYFRAPHSFTGEEVVELHAHGSPRLLELLLKQVLSGGEARLAEPGEFTRRAYLNGRMDLARAEGVAELIAAQSEAAVRAAAAQVSGTLSTQVSALRRAALTLQADLEGALDFPTEAEGAEADCGPRLLALSESVRGLLRAARAGQLVRTGARVVLFGPVNAGKSTLFNALVNEDKALVDEEPGTTRDLLEARVEWNGLPLTLVDTAGLRDEAKAGRVERLGMERTRAALAQADVALLVRPGWVGEDWSSWRALAPQAALLEVQGKCDLAQGPTELLAVSGQTGQGLEALRREVLARLWEDGTPEAIALLSDRHRDALQRAEQSLGQALEAHRFSTLEAVAGEVGFAVQALGEITGQSASEELLDLIFQRFCIGK